MKKLVSLIIAMSIFFSINCAIFATNVSYMADFESADAKFGNSTTYSGTKNTAGDYSDFVKPEWVADGGKENSTGLRITYKAATWYAGEVFFPIPVAWQNGADAEYLNFDYNGKGIVNISLSTGSAATDTLTKGTKYSYKLNADTNGEWQSISIPLSEFKNNGNPVTIANIGCVTFQAGENGGLSNSASETKAMTAAELEAKARNGSIIFDNMELSNVGENVLNPNATPEPTEKPDNTTRTIDFDTYTLSHKQTWAGFNNNDKTYSDSIKSEITENGKEGCALELTYKAATWYAGEIFMSIPKEWAINKNSECLEFDAKGQGKIKISLETGEVVNGIRYGHAVTINTNDEWQKISVPLSEFVNNGNEVPLTDVVGMAFSAAESGNLDNNAEETKMMSADELEEKAVTGCVVIDNITLAEQDTTSPTAAPEATTQPTGISYVADFETADTKFASGKTWGGFKNKSNDYQDYIKAKWLQDGGVDGSTAFCVYYQSATYYAGEIFVPAPAVWTNNGAKGAEYLNFDYKGKGAVKISFSTGNTADGTLTSGTRYTRRFELDSHGDWANISVPLSEIVNGENDVNMTEIGTVTFQAAENANLDNNSDDTKAMSADELKEIARTGEIIFDNMTLSETEGKTTLFSSVKVTAEIDGKEITNLTNGDIKIKAIASDIEKDTNMVMIVAVYKENGVIDTVRMAEQKIIGDGELMLDLNVTDAEHQTMKVFIFDDFTNLHPIINVTNFL